MNFEMSSETDKVIKIINAVRRNECLWNVNSSEYAKRDRLERAWNDVAQEVGKSDVYCRDKWRNVRTGFLRSVQHQIRINHDESVPSDFHTVKRKRFYLHDQMAFLVPSAKSLELARKKRKLSLDPKTIIEMEDANSNDNYGDNTMSEYGTVRKFEHSESDVEEIQDEELESNEEHTFESNASATVDNEVDNPSADNSNYEEILKEMENMANGSSSTIQQPPPVQQHSGTVQQSQNYQHSPTTNKVIRLINEQLNEEIITKSTSNVNNSLDLYSSSLQPRSLSSSHRDEEQLMNFFRSSIDDILSLDKRKQRQFKKRMLDVIDELHDA